MVNRLSRLAVAGTLFLSLAGPVSAEPGAVERLTNLDTVLAVRTGEDTFFANVLCRAGVPFGPAA